MTVGAAGAGGSVVGGAAAVLMIAIALNAPSAWRSESVDPVQERPLFLRPEVAAHVRRHRTPHAAAAAVQPTAATGPVALERPVRAFAAGRHREPQARRHRRAAPHHRHAAKQTVPAAPPVAPAPAPAPVASAAAPAPVAPAPAAPPVVEQPARQVKHGKPIPPGHGHGRKARPELSAPEPELPAPAVQTIQEAPPPATVETPKKGHGPKGPKDDKGPKDLRDDKGPKDDKGPHGNGKPGRGGPRSA
jgi:hypothetical protein